ncbi:uncharacterized protein Dvar_83690 [Desulfosarcina variabilis str. Montpellier]
MRFADKSMRRLGICRDARFQVPLKQSALPAGPSVLVPAQKTINNADHRTDTGQTISKKNPYVC